MDSIEGRFSGLRRKKSRSALRSVKGMMVGELSGSLTGTWSLVAESSNLIGSSFLSKAQLCI